MAARNPGGISRICGAAALLALLGGCQADSMDRRDSISASAGNAQAINRILQIRDPWPPGAWDKGLDHDGERMKRAVDQYRDPPQPVENVDQESQELSSGPTTDGI